jgi:hypothetical protein
LDEAVWRAQAGLPVGIDRRTRRLVSLERALAEPEALAAPGELTVAERAMLARTRWEAGDWSDVFYCGTFVDLQRAVAELEQRSPLGLDLLQTTERAIEMVLEDASA